MNRHLVRLVASVATVSVLSMAGTGMASATQPGSASAEASNSAPAAQLQKLHDQIDAAYKAGDAKALLGSVTELRPVLASVRDIARSNETLHVVEEADDTSVQIQQKLKQDPQLLPGLPSPIALVTDLVSTLLTLVLSLVAGLLGGLPLPVPVPPLPVPPVPPIEAPIPVPVPTP
jgi:hypothetical protein